MANKSISHTSGIYIVVNIKNGKVYIGKAKDLHRRWNDHKRMLNEGSHFNRHLQFAWDKYKEKAFSFKILEYCSVDQLNEREIHHIAIYRARGLAYNLTNGGDGLSNMTEEIRSKIGDGMRGKTHTDETKRKMSEAHKGLPRSEEHKRRLSESQLGKIVSEETRLKQSEAAKRRLPISDETRKKMSESSKGNTHMVGKHPSEETLKRMSESMKRTLARKRAEQAENDHA